MSRRCALTVAILTCFALPASAHPEKKLELEVGGGVATVDTPAPLLTLRGAVDLWNFFSVGLQALDVVGAPSESSQGGSPVFSAWAAYPEVRVHLPTRYVQGFFSVGLGVGQIVVERGEDPEFTPTHGRVGLCGEVGLGVRALAGPVIISVEANVTVFTRVMGGNPTYDEPPTAADEARPYAVPMGTLTLGVGWRGAL